MFTLVYTSTEAWAMHRQDLLLILSQSRPNNVNYGITGILVYHKSRFLQVLEGEQNNVNHLYRSICKDPRNKSVTTLLSKNIEQRNFPDWSMAFVSALEEEKDNIPGFSNFFEEDWDATKLVKQSDEVFELLQQFKRDPQLRKLVEL